MRFYGYKYNEAMQLDARQFFLLLNEINRINSSEKLDEINTIIVPHLKKEDAKKIIRRYEDGVRDYDELLQVDTDYSNLDKLKGKL